MIRTHIRIGKPAALLLFLLTRLAVIAAETKTTSQTNELSGKVVGVHDGDSITVLTAAKEQIKIRFHGIDAPELGQAFGQNAKKKLSEQVFGKTVRVMVVDTDRYGRTVGNVYVGETWVNLEMVAYGMAWHYTQYSKDPRLAEAQESAKAKKLGLWQDMNPVPVPPWAFRKKARER